MRAPEPSAGRELDRVGGCVLVSTGVAQPFSRGLLVPIEGRAAEHPEHFPTLAGALRLEPAGAARCRLRLDAHCEPAGRGGRWVDRTVLARLAEAYAGGFLEGVAACLADQDGVTDVVVAGAATIAPAARK